MYSKLGGCLGVTAYVGSFSQNRPLSLGQGLLERLRTHLGVGIFLGRSWGPSRGVGAVVFPGDSVVLLGGLGNPIPIGTPIAWPDGPIRSVGLTCLGSYLELPPSLLGRGVEGGCCLSWADLPGGCQCCGLVASFLGREGAQLPGNCFLPGREGVPLPGSCFLPGREGAQLPGDCCLPGKEAEQWPEGVEGVGPSSSCGRGRGPVGGVLMPSPWVEGRGHLTDWCYSWWGVINVVISIASYISFYFID